MPKVGYNFKDAAGQWHEDDVIARDEDKEAYPRSIVHTWNTLCNSKVELVNVEVIDAFIHTHQWFITISGGQTAGRDYLVCKFCEVTAKRMPGHRAILDPEFADIEYCIEKPPAPTKPPKFK